MGSGPTERIDLERLRASLRDLHPMTDTSVRLAALAEKEDCSVSDFAAVIQRDANVAARLLKLANSAFYGVRGGVSSIARAVSFIGFSAVQELVLCIQAHAMLEGTGRAPPGWQTSHNQAVAGLSRWLATTAAPAVRDQALTAGLMHDLGRMALHALFPAQLTACLEAFARGAGPELELETERETMGLDHQQVGQVVAEVWRFPSPLIQVISGHTGPAPAAAPGGYDAVQRLCDVVAIADAWAWQLGAPGLPGGKPFLPHASRVERSGLSATPPADQRDALLKLLRETPPL